MTTQKNFLGIPVEGDITPGASREKQRPLEDFQPILQAVLDDPTIVEFGWTQATPYFNDGEPCEFSAHSLWVRTDADREVEDEYEMELGYNHPSLGKRPKTWDSATKDWSYQQYEGPDEARYDRCLALSKAIEGGEFYDVLLEAFGDHARLTVRETGIEIEFYEHD
ncbi:hypothetical protein [Streptomyces lacrimifluminis]|uniref:hypothetical protein n=1 Tax=Streptomyces lacrimifluminis TaxID=1500077 RepID=UPI0031E8D2ED